MEIPTLQTDRLLLRPFSAADVDAYLELNGNPGVMRCIDKVQDREAAFRSLCANIGHWHVRGYGPWAVEDRATGHLIGRAGVLAWEGKPGPEVGYAIDPGRREARRVSRLRGCPEGRADPGVSLSGSVTGMSDAGTC